MTVDAAAPPAQAHAGPRVPRVPALAAVAFGATSIGALLGDLYGVLSMATFGRYITAPALAALALLGAKRAERVVGPELQRRIRVGAVAGVVGTIGYDLFRLPFVPLGLRLFAPIDSYGLLLADAEMATPWTSTLGWLFHLSNGVTFGVMYAVVAARRHWGWGIVWAMILETAVVVSPFGARYALAVQPAALAAAYWGHLGFGYPVGRLVQRLDRTDHELRSTVPRAAAATVLVAALAIVVWLEPWSASGTRRAAGRAAERSGLPTAIVEKDRFVPEWLRVEKGGCIEVVNRSATELTSKGRDPVAPGHTARWCFDDPGAHRARVGTRPYSGGFVYVER